MTKFAFKTDAKYWAAFVWFLENASINDLWDAVESDLPGIYQATIQKNLRAQYEIYAKGESCP